MSGKQALFCHEAGTRGAKGTIIFIHGALGSWEDWELNVPYFEKDYHLLLPDLPRHGRSQDITPFSTELSAQLLADIIRNRAENGKAHVIGLSLGLSVALKLMSSYPELVNDGFVSGYNRFPSGKYLGRGFWFSEKVEALVPNSLISWLMDGTQLSGNRYTKCSLSLCEEIVNPLGQKSNDDWPSAWPAKTLIMCAGKGGIIPSADQPHAAIKLREIAHTINTETVAYTHPRMRHPWHRQDVELFCTTARMWFEEGKVPDGFIEL